MLAVLEESLLRPLSYVLCHPFSVIRAKACNLRYSIPSI